MDPIGTAISDAPAADAVVDDVVIPDTTDPGDGSQTDTSADPDPGAPPESGTEPLAETKEDGRVLPQWIKGLKESNPEQFKRAKAEFYEMRDRRTVHPTIQAARDEHDLVESIGGREGIENMREEVGFFKTASQQFFKGDPAFIQSLFQEDPIAAALHVQPMLEAFQKADAVGYASTIAKTWQNEFRQVGFAENGLEPLKAAIASGNRDVASSILKSIEDWYKSIEETASKAEDPRVKSLLAERARQRDTQQQAEQGEFLKGYRTEAVNSVVAEGEKVFESFFKGRKLDAEDRKDLFAESMRIANRAVEADKDFASQRDKHLERGDSRSALKLTQARYARELKTAVQRVARRYGVSSGAPAQQQNPKQPNQQQQQNIPTGWVRANSRPQAEEIDRSRTSNDMIISGKAILRDGRKVDWSHLKRTAY